MWLTSLENREDGGGELGSDELFREPGGTGERETRGKTERGSRPTYRTKEGKKLRR